MREHADRRAIDPTVPVNQPFVTASDPNALPMKDWKNGLAPSAGDIAEAASIAEHGGVSPSTAEMLVRTLG